MNTDSTEIIDCDEIEKKMTPETLVLYYLCPPHVRNADRILTDEELEYIYGWIGLQHHISPQKAKMIIHQLGLWTSFGTINKDRAYLISDYIWNRYPAAPNFPALLEWLEKNHPQENIIFSTPSITPPKNKDHTKARKRKKQAQKKSQRRNRKK